ncbi:hypothetical protein ACRRTK_013737 [Alexandromys fortis]
MERTPDLGLGDSSLHRYLDGEFWTLKNEMRRALGSSPLFQPRLASKAISSTSVLQTLGIPYLPEVYSFSAVYAMIAQSSLRTGF